MMHYRIYCS